MKSETNTPTRIAQEQHAAFHTPPAEKLKRLVSVTNTLPAPTATHVHETAFGK